MEDRPVEIPVGEIPLHGLRNCLDPTWVNGAQPVPGDSGSQIPREPAEDSKLPLTVLAPGDYSVYARASSEGAEYMGLCTSFDVTIDGDTVVDLPELAEC